MKLKNTAFTNNVSVWTPSINDYRSNPDWGMEVGQSDKHTFTETGIEEILTAMVYYKIHDESEIMVGLGKGGKLQHYYDYNDKEFVLTSLFPKVYLNGKKLKSQKLLLYITKDLRRKNSRGEPNPHFERRQLKFSKNLTYQGQEVNRNCIDAISDIYGQNSSWAVLKIKILNEDELHLYGIKISDDERKYKNKEIRNEEFEKLWKEQHPNESLNEEKSNHDLNNEKRIIELEQFSFTPSQVIYYGVPGCGKSFEVNKIIDNKLDEYGVSSDEKEKHKVRCVFHPEYSNADFVGQIFPYVKPNKGGVEYRFKPGPFAEVVRRAFRNPTEPFFLVIEEINRGNAAAIFGEAFQLLDRIKPGDAVDNSTGNEYGEGWSSYGIDNVDVNGYIRQIDTNNPETVEYDESVSYSEKIKLENYTSIRLPPNLSIFATMNTSDQNVIATDNAFQRRFKSRMIRNKLSNEVFPGKAQYDIQIDGTGVCWGKFRDWINGKILSPENGISKADDKCLGGWFISTSVKEKNAEGVATKFEDISREDFAEKVLKYLWDDVFKRNAANNIFNKDEFKSLSDLIDAFEEKDGESYVLNGFDAFDKIFKTTEDDKKALRDE